MSQEKQKKAQSFSQNLDKESQLEEDLKVDFFQGLSGRRKKPLSF
jgi:hypothetical protein